VRVGPRHLISALLVLSAMLGILWIRSDVLESQILVDTPAPFRVEYKSLMAAFCVVCLAEAYLVYKWKRLAILLSILFSFVLFAENVIDAGRSVFALSAPLSPPLLILISVRFVVAVALFLSSLRGVSELADGGNQMIWLLKEEDAFLLVSLGFSAIVAGAVSILALAIFTVN